MSHWPLCCSHPENVADIPQSGSERLGKREAFQIQLSPQLPSAADFLHKAIAGVRETDAPPAAGGVAARDGDACSGSRSLPRLRRRVGASGRVRIGDARIIGSGAI